MISASSCPSSYPLSSIACTHFACTAAAGCQRAHATQPGIAADAVHAADAVYAACAWVAWLCARVAAKRLRREAAAGDLIVVRGVDEHSAVLRQLAALFAVDRNVLVPCGATAAAETTH
eukprot:SAG11_NODE_410_length_9703_cov_3.284777_8_plen_119_part_00